MGSQRVGHDWGANSVTFFYFKWGILSKRNFLIGVSVRFSDFSGLLWKTCKISWWRSEKNPVVALARSKEKSESLTLWDPMDSIDHGIFQVRILEWVAVPCFRGSSQLRNWIQVSITTVYFPKEDLLIFILPQEMASIHHCPTSLHLTWIWIPECVFFSHTYYVSALIEIDLHVNTIFLYIVLCNIYHCTF